MALIPGELVKAITMVTEGGGVGEDFACRKQIMRRQVFVL